MFGLVDVNNFYASCEQLFRPDLRSRPVVVLSNNDGCVVARSPMAKAMGIKMGQPAFQLRDHAQSTGLVMLSSNYPLYADMSSRVMVTLESLSPAVEVYSIDEAFAALDGMSLLQLESWGRDARATIQRDQGLTVGVGIAPTKTLAKAANWAAKKWPATEGVVVLTDPARRRRLLSLMPVQEVWGVGSRLHRRLNAEGVHTALQLAAQGPERLQERYSVVLARTACELAGTSCMALDLAPQAKQQIVVSRSFGDRVTSLPVLQEALSNYVARAAEKMRSEGMATLQVAVFVRTSWFSPSEPRYSNTAVGRFPSPTADTRDLLALARQLLQRIWRPGFRYAKAGVMLTDLVAMDGQQGDLFLPAGRDPRVMEAMDRINRSGYGRVAFASQGAQLRRPWKMKQQQLSPAYTTRWSDIIQTR